MNKLDKKYNILLPVKNEKLKRMGRNLDGGYVVDESISKNCKTLISFGLGDDWSFEKDYLKKNNDAKVYIYDHTVSIWPYLKDVLKILRRFVTFRENLKSLSERIKKLINYVKFINSKKIKFYKEKIVQGTINQVFSRVSSNEKVIIKIDIEGSEFEIIDELSQVSGRVEMAIFEFHELDKNEKIFLSSIKKLQDKFTIVHLHGNNHCSQTLEGLPIALEMTLINKRYQSEKIDYIKKFPRDNLDYPNNPYKEDLAFYFE
mgnify:FL=1|tara:strand:- start:115 stop:894 length:780 start_codon:yes stop_codon:yes gene_type:complete